jgi:Uma2 family endonuclease
MSTVAPPPDAVVYPDSDGKPMAENTLQYQWIVMIRENIARLFHDRPDVFVAADNLIYPVRGDATTCTAPDVYVAFGRPPGHRGSYKVWEEGGIFPQVIFEVLSPSNTAREMGAKRDFYQRHGAEEYYVIDPDAPGVDEARVRRGRRLREVDDLDTFVSPRLGIRFDTRGPELVLYRPDGERFRSFVELGDLLEEERELARQQKRLAEAEKQRADAEAAAKAKLAAKLRELGVDPETL